MELNISTKQTFVHLGITLAMGLTLSACGGGGGTTSGGTPQVAQFPNPTQYVGTWASACDFYKLQTVVVTDSGGVLQTTSTTQVFTAANCTGPVLATSVSASPSLTYLETVNALVPLSTTGSASNISVDKVRIAVGQYQQVVTGSTVYDKTGSSGPQRCVDVATGSTCWDSGVKPATTIDGGIYLSGTTLYTMSLAANGLYTVNGLYNRGPGGTPTPAPPPSAPKPNPVTVAPTLNCSAAGVAASVASTAATTVCMLTSKGEIVIALESVKAPLTTANFLQYVNSKFYNNTIFHRVVPGFVVQGGGLVSGYTTKAGELAPVALENQNGLLNVRGTIAMARTSAPDSATNQFFFNTVDNKFLDYSAALAGKNGYAVFGSVISGLATVDAIDMEPQFYAGADATATEVVLYWAQRLK